MPASPTPTEWLTKAADTRQLADTMTDAGACRTLLMIAASYEDMARRASLMRSLNLPLEQDGDG